MVKSRGLRAIGQRDQWKVDGVRCMARRLAVALSVIALIGSSSAAEAQKPDSLTRDTARVGPVAPRPGATPSTVAAPDSDKQLVPLFGLRDAAVAASFVAATVGLFEVDKIVAKNAQNQVTQANRFLKDVSKPSEIIAWPGSLIISGGLYAAGRMTQHRRLSEIGLHGTEAIVLAAGVTNLVKGMVGRARPFVSADTSPNDFKFGGGFGHENRSSFPSGHTTTAFAAASAIASETRSQWPHAWWSAWVVAPVLYTGAAVVGVSRMYHNKHWASDVMLGAAIGTFSGIKVVQYTHSHPRNRLDRLLLGTHVAPNAHGGVAISWSLPAP